jgi:hypothetical protein
MKSPDVVLAALALKGVLTVEEADALSDEYHRKPTFDEPDPLPNDLYSALALVNDLFGSIEDDHDIEDLLGLDVCEDAGLAHDPEPVDLSAYRSYVPDDDPDLPPCECPECEDEDEDDLPPEDVDAALSLWFGLKGALQSALT